MKHKCFGACFVQCRSITMKYACLSGHIPPSCLVERTTQDIEHFLLTSYGDEFGVMQSQSGDIRAFAGHQAYVKSHLEIVQLETCTRMSGFR